MGEPALLAATAPVPIVNGGLTTGVNATRSYAVGTASNPGDTLLAIVAGNNSSGNLAITGLTDSKGNQWVLDGTQAGSPGTYEFRCPGATGGPGGGPTVALTTSDTLSVAMSATLSAQVGMLAVAVSGVGALDPGQEAQQGSSGITQLGVTLTPSVSGGTLVALGSGQNAASPLSFDVPLTAGTQVTTTGVQLPAWSLGSGVVAGTPVTLTMHGAASANLRLGGWLFLPLVQPPGTVLQSSPPVHLRSLTGPVALTLPSPTGSGNTLVVCTTTNGTTGNPLVSGVTTGGAADHWAKVSQKASATRNDAEIWYDPNAAAGQTAVAVSYSGGSGTGDLYAQVFEVAGILYPDQTVGAESGPSMSWSCGPTGTIQQAAEVFFGVMINTASIVPTITGVGTWTTTSSGVSNTYCQVAGYQNVSAVGTATWQGTTPGPTGGQQTITVATFATAPVGVTGSGGIAAKKVGLAGSGTVTIPPVTGTGAISAKKVGLAGSGTVSVPGITGTGTFRAKKVALSGAGAYMPPVTGSGAIAAKKIGLAGIGTFGTGIAGSGGVAAKKIKLAGAGAYTPPVTGTGAFAAKKIGLSGAGTVSAPIPPVTGTGSFTAKKIKLAGFGTYPAGAPPALLVAPPPLLIPVTWDALSLNDGERGDGLCTVVTNVDGWYGSPPLNGSDLNRALTDGALFGFKTVQARVVVITGAVAGTRDLCNLVARQLAAQAVNSQPANLTIGEDDGSGAMPLLTASVRADTSSLTLAWLSRTYFTYQVELTAADPRLYGAAWQTAQLTPAPAGGATGRVYPFTEPRFYASSDVPNMTRLANPGSAPAPVWASYTGDLSDSRLTDGRNTIHLAPVGAGQVIVVNTETLAAAAPGGAQRQSYLEAGTTPLTIAPFSTATWSFYGTGRGQVVLSWREVVA